MKFFKGQKSKKTGPAPVPRLAEEIIKESSEIFAKAGTVQFNMVSWQRELDNLNAKLTSLSYEFEARKELDKATEPEVIKETK